MRKYSKRKFVKNKRPSGKAKGSRIKKRKSTNRTKNRGKNRKRTMRGGALPTYLQILQIVNATKAKKITNFRELYDFPDAGSEEEIEFNRYRDKLMKRSLKDEELKTELKKYITKELAKPTLWDRAMKEKAEEQKSNLGVISDPTVEPGTPTQELNPEEIAMLVVPPPDFGSPAAEQAAEQAAKQAAAKQAAAEQALEEANRKADNVLELDTQQGKKNFEYLRQKRRPKKYGYKPGSDNE